MDESSKETQISERTKKMVYQALGALQSELDVMGLTDQGTEVFAMSQHLKVLDEQGKLTVRKTS